jgi:TonB-linked SusC/RagA family outer membrane protein
MMDASQYAALHNEMRTNAGGAAAGFDLNPLFADPQSLGAGTNWLDEIFGQAQMQKVAVSIAGGDKVIHSTSLGYYKQDGVLKNTGYDRVTLQSNIRSELFNKFRITSNIALSGEARNVQDAYTVIANAMRILPHVPVRDENGNFTGPLGRADLNGQAINPVAIVETQTNKTNTFRGVANVSGEYDITDYLQFKTTAGTETGFDFNNTFYPKFKWGNYQQNETSQSGSSAYEMLLIWDNTLTFNKKFGKHSLTALAGTSFQDYTKRWLNATGVGRASDMTTELDNALEAKSVGGNRSDWATMSYLGRVNYSYDNRYFLTASIRADGSSRFGPENRFGYFPSFSGAWTVSNEDFMKNISAINFLKLRLGYGQTGNQLIDNYIYSDKLEVEGQYNFGSSRGFPSIPVGIIYPNKLSNPAVKWESVEQYNAGVDVSFLNNRISFTADFYLKNTNDMLTRVPVPQTSGYSLSSGDWPYMNIGKVRNTGMEFTVNTTNVDTKDFRWESGFNIAFNKNKVVDVGGVDIYGTNSIIEGEPINVFYGYAVDHVYQNIDDVFTGPAMENRAADRAHFNPALNTAPGDIAFKKFTSGEVLTDSDRVIIGSPHPVFTAGLNNTLSYKNVDLSFFIQAVYGNEIFNHVRLEHEGMATTFNQLASTANRWTGEGTSYDMPRAVYADPNNNIRVSDRFLEDGSFLKIRNVTLSYNLPKQWTKVMRVKVYANIDNLVTLTHYSGLDPEVGINGYDNFIYPPARTVLFGINVKF